MMQHRSVLLQKKIRGQENFPYRGSIDDYKYYLYMNLLMLIFGVFSNGCSIYSTRLTLL